MAKSGGPTGQKFIRSDKSRLFSGQKDRQWLANFFVDTTAQAVLIRKSEVNNTILTDAIIKEPAKCVQTTGNYVRDKHHKLRPTTPF